MAPATPTGAAATTAGDSQGWAWAVVVSGLGLGLALGAVKRGRSLRRYATRDPRRVAVAARAEVVDFARDQGVDIRAGVGMSELRRMVEKQLGVPAGAFADSFSRARYGPPDTAAGVAARRDARRLVHAMRARLGPGRRVRGYFALRSLRRT